MISNLCLIRSILYAETIETRGLLGQEDMKLDDICFQPSQPGLDLAHIFTDLSLGP